MDAAHSRPKLPTAKWGAACAACATAKAKCIRSSSDESKKCDRCERLYKDCSKQVHRPRKKRVSRPSRTTQLESKLNGLVSYLKVSGDWEKASNDLDADHAYATGSSDVGAQASPSISISDSFRSSTTSPWSVPSTYNSSAPPYCICRANPGVAPPPPATDEALLDEFRSHFTTIHPFVVIPSETTAAELNATRPFLMSAIRMVTSYRSLKSMRAQMYRIMVHVSDHMLIHSERSLDLLLGLIVVLACTLCTEMSLNRDPGLHERSLLMTAKPTLVRARTNEERRAFAGVWFLSSAMSLGFGQIEPMRYTFYLDECVRHLEEYGECATDARLVHMVRIQHLTERISRLSSKDKTFEEVTNIPAAPMSAYISAFVVELDTLSQSLPTHLKDDYAIVTYLNTARLRLHEPPAVDKALIDSLSEALASPHNGAGSHLDRIYQSANALQIWFDHWLSIPPERYHLHTTSIGSQVVYALIMLSRWARLATPRTMFGSDTAMPPDPSRRPGNESAYDLQTAAERVASTGGVVPTFSIGNSSIHFKAMDDPSLPESVAVLRSRLKKQHGLKINIPFILSSVHSRFEQANDSLQAMSVEEGKVEPNVWSMGAIKMRITQAKLELWAETVAEKTEQLSLSESRYPPSSHHGEETDSHEQGETYGVGVAGVTPMEGIGIPPGFGDGDQWMTEGMGGFDPSLWFDGFVDWGQMVVNSSGEFSGQSL